MPPVLGVPSIPVKVNFNVTIDANSRIELFSEPFVIPQNIIVAERNLPVSALYDEGGQTGLLEVWEPSDAQGDIKTQLANTDSSGNGQGGPDLSGAYQVACKAFAQGLQAVLCDKFDCSGVTPFSITRYAGIEQYTKQRDFGRVALAYFAHVLFGHVDATAAITNDVAFVQNMLSINAAGADETADGPDNRAAAWTKSITDPVESWDASGNENDANLALRLVEAVVAKGKNTDGSFKISSVSTATSDSLANIVKQVIGQDSSRLNNVDGSERTRNQHQLLRFYPDDIIYMNINVQPPTVEVANHTPNPSNVANPPSTTNMVAKSFTLKIRLTDGDPFLYSDNTNTTIIGYKGTVPTTLTIPSGVTAIADDAFLNATTLVTVNLPVGLLSIGARAFKGCTALTTIEVPSSVLTIGESAFEGCTSLTTAYLPGTGTKNLQTLQKTLIGTLASTASIPLRLMRNREIIEPTRATPYVPKQRVNTRIPKPRAVNPLIPKGKGKSMPKLRTLPNAAKSVFAVIPVSAFRGCTSLSTVFIPATVTTIKANAFENTTALATVTLPAAVTTIESAAFKAAGLTEITLPPNLEAIPSNAFQNCVELVAIEIPENVVSIGALAFYGCVKLEEVIVNEGVETIATQAFQDCAALTFVELPNTLQTIAERAFQGAFTQATQAATPITVIVPITVTYAPATANFPSFPSAVTVNYIEPTTNVVYSTSAATEVVSFGRPEPPAPPPDPTAPPPPPPPPPTSTALTIPAGTTTIKAGAFRDTSTIAFTSVSIPSSVTTIEAGAFTSTSLSTVLVPIDTTVASGAFESAVVLNYVDFATNLVYPPAAKTSMNTINGYNGTIPAIVALPSSVLTVKAGTFTGSALTTLRHNIFTTVESGAIETSVARQYIHYATNFVYEDTGFTTLAGYYGTVPSSLSIAASVTTIRANAFASNAQLTSVTIPSSVASIEAGAFSATGLTTVRVPVNCTLASGAFNNTTTVQYVDYDTDFIYSDAAKTTLAAYNAAIPSALTIPSGVTTIEAAAFSGATTLRSVSIPASVTSMGAAVFSGCTFLGSATVDAQLTTMPASTFMNCPFLSNVTLPTTLVTIGSQAFRNTAFTSVDLPNVLDIGAQAFFNNTAITTITAPSATRVAADAFTGCTAIQDYPASASTFTIAAGGILTAVSGGSVAGRLRIPEGVSTINASLFLNQTSMIGVNFPTTLRNISTAAFSNTGIRELTLPATVSSLGVRAFNRCIALSSIAWPATPISTIQSDIFASCPALRTAVIPSWMTSVPTGLFNGTGVRSIVFEGNPTTIGGFAFATTQISSFNAPTSLTTIGDRAFLTCYNLSTVTLGNITAMGGRAFESCTALQSIVIPATYSVSLTNSQNFSSCTALGSATYANNTELIQTGMFDGCTSLSTLTFANINALSTIGGNALRNTRISSFNGPNVITIGTQAFANNPNLSTVFAPNVNRVAADAFTGCTALQDYPASASTFTIAAGGILTAVSGGSVAGRLRIPTGVSTINASVFLNQSTMIGVSFPTTLRNISTQAFRNTGLRDITIPETVSSLGSIAFGYCTALSSITFPATAISTIQADVFRDCTALQTAIVPSWMTSVPAGMYNNATGVRSIDIQGNTTTIGAYAFYSTAISSFSSPTSLTAINGNVFQNCRHLSTVTLGNLGNWGGANTFAGCTALQSIVIPATVFGASGNTGQFLGCTSLGSASYLNSLTSMAQTTFDGCTSLSTLTFANVNTLSNIGAWALRNTRIASFNGPNVSSINAGAFASNTNLTSVSVPNATFIASDAFTGCTALSVIPTAVAVPQVPSAPTSLSATAGNGTAAITFTAGATGGSAITNYKYSIDNGATFIAFSPAQTTSPVTISGLTNGTAYSIQLRAVNAVGDGTASASVSATPQTTPSAPTSLSATPGDQSVQIAFTAGSNGGSAITNYKYSIDDGATFIAFSPAQTTSPVTITGLTNGTAYSIQLRAVNAVGDGIASTTISVTVSATTQVPKQLKTDWALALSTDNANISSSLFSTGYSTKVDANGNIYVAGLVTALGKVYVPNINGNSYTLSSIYISPLSTSTANSSGFLIKYNSSGIAQWATRIPSGSASSVRGIVLDSNGDVYITGSYRSTTSFALINASGDTQVSSTITLPASSSTPADAFLVKYNSNGIVQWATAIRGNGTTLDDVGFGIAIDATNSVYITGQYRQADIITPLTLQDALLTADGSGNWQAPSGSGVTLPANVVGSADVFLVKYNSNGTVQWATAIRGNVASSDDIGYGIAVDSTNSVYITGQYRHQTTSLTLQNASGNGQANSTVTLPINTTTNADIFLVKYDSNGIVQWATCIRGNVAATAGDIGFGIAVDSTNSVYITGQYRHQTTSLTLQNASGNGQANSTVTLPVNSALQTDVFLVKYNSNGIVQWATAICGGGSSTETGFGIAVDSTNSVYITGQYRTATTVTPLTLQNASGNGQVFSSVTLPASVAASTDVFLVKYNSNGIVQWATAICGNGTTSDIGYGIAVDATNSVYITGQYSTANTSTSLTLQNALLTADGSSNWQANSAIVLPPPQTSGSGGAFLVKYNSNGIAQFGCPPLYTKGNLTISSGTTISRQHGMAKDSSGNIYIIGSYTAPQPLILQNRNGSGQTESTITLPATISNTGSDVYIIKYNSNGIVQWATVIRGNNLSNNDIGFGIAVDATNSVYITGQYRQADLITPLTLQDASGNGQVNSTITLPATAAGSTDVFLVKYNSNGIVQWATAIRGNGTSSDIGYGIAIDATNSVYITGQYRQADIITPLTLQDALLTADGSGNWQANSLVKLPANVAVFIDVFLVKYNSNGIVQWATAIRGNHITTGDIGYGIAVDSTNSVYITGQYRQADIITPLTLQDALLTADGSGNWQANSLVKLPANIASSTDVFLVKYNSNGIVQWATAIRGNNTSTGDIGYGIAVDATNSVYITGQYRQVDTTTALTLQDALLTGDVSGNWQSASGVTLLANVSASTDVFLVKYNSNGIVQWATAIRGNSTGSTDTGNAIVIDINNNIYLTGCYLSTNSSVNLLDAIVKTQAPSDYTLPQSSIESYYLVKYNSNGIVKGASTFIPSNATVSTSGSRGFSCIASSDKIYVYGSYNVGGVAIQDAEADGFPSTSSVTMPFTVVTPFLIQYTSGNPVITSELVPLFSVNFNSSINNDINNYNGGQLSTNTPSGTGFSYSTLIPNMLYKPITIAATNTFTFAASVYRTETSDYAGIFFTRTFGATGLNLHASTNKISYHWNEVNAGDSWDSGYTVPLNTWVHIVLTIAPTAAILYVNGAPTAIRSGISHPAIAMTDLYLGADPAFSGNSRVWAGLLDNLAVYNKRLSAEEVMTIYTATLSA
jgi:hypothetical protein